MFCTKTTLEQQNITTSRTHLPDFLGFPTQESRLSPPHPINTAKRPKQTMATSNGPLVWIDCEVSNVPLLTNLVSSAKLVPCVLISVTTN